MVGVEVTLRQLVLEAIETQRVAELGVERAC
jgi:hypothetical protein